MPNTPKILGATPDCPACVKAKEAQGRIPVPRVVEKLDACFAKNDLTGAARLLDYWQGEAVALGDLSGELSMVNEWLGLSRKLKLRERGEEAITRALELLPLTDMEDTVSGATVLLNAATTCKAFGAPERALPLYERAEAIYGRELQPQDLRHAALCNNMATTLGDLGRYSEADALYLRAIALTEGEVEALPDCAITYVNRAHLYEAWEGVESPHIEEFLMRADALLSDARIPEGGYLAFVCEKCAPSFDYFGFFRLKKKYETRARELYARA